ncbi:hypothetical protein LTR46_003486 [Exophiala xenobiotica]|nr:hypothetical protein LTR55_004028 [Exophiala xenobiotica]KAK5558237.1 hypothetical protein LTR46_003486 [Exophiala xenobiotica]
MAQPCSLATGRLSGDFLTDSPRLARSQLARLTKHARARKERNALYRSKLRASQLPKEVAQFHAENPEGYGLPRAYKVTFIDLDETVDDHAIKDFHEHSIVFGHFGKDTGGISLNGHKIQPSDVRFSVATNSYTFMTSTDIPGIEGQVQLTGYFNFMSPRPSGSLGVDGRVYNVILDPKPLWFDTDVSAKAGAAFSSGLNKITWDPQSDTWKKAKWEKNTVEFGYDTKTIPDPIFPGGLHYVENFFKDITSTPATTFSLTAAQYSSGYTSFFDGELMHTSAKAPPDPPASRKDYQVKTVFPKELYLLFSEFGDSFTGAYTDAKGINIYAASGTVQMQLSNVLPALASKAVPPPVKDTFEFLNESDDHETSDIKVMDSPTSVLPMLSYDVMIPDKEDPSGYSDQAATLAMEDFHNIIVYYMDEDLRTTFVRSSPIELPPSVKAVADDDIPNNTIFYKSLQVPYITTMLAASSNIDEGKNCNGIRATKRLKTLPSNDPVYKRHSSKLYQAQFDHLCDGFAIYRTDQVNVDYSKKIDKIKDVLIQTISDNSQDLKTADKNYEADLASAKADVLNLYSWTHDQKLYWAFMLYYWVQKASLPNWYAQYTGGSKSSNIGMSIKKLNSLFGSLENHNVAPDSQRSFMQSFNETLRMFQMTSIIPQLVDPTGKHVDFDSILKDCLNAFWNHYQDVGKDDPSIQELVGYAKQLDADDKMRKDFLVPFFDAARVAGAAGNWTNTMTQWADMVSQNSWFKGLAQGAKLLRTMQYVAGAALLLMPLMPGMWSSMREEDKTKWAINVAGFLAPLAVKIAQGVVRLYYLWEDITSLTDVYKVMMGEKSLEQISGSSVKIESATARFFTRTEKDTLAMEAEASALPFGEVESFSIYSRMFGRNMGEVLCNVAGIVLGIASLVLTSIDLHKETDPTLKADDALFLISGCVQILGIVMGWVAVAAASAAEGSYERTPTQKFLDEHVKPEGLYMDHLAIDYFDVVAGHGDNASLVGLGLKPGLMTTRSGFGTRTEPITPDETVYLHLSTPPGIDLLAKLDYTLDSVWSLQTDAFGNSQVYTKRVTSDSTTGDSITTFWYISVSDDGAGVIIRQLPANDGGETYSKALASTYWNITTVADPTLAPSTGTAPGPPIAALVRMQQQGKYLTLIYDGNDRPTSLALTDGRQNHTASHWMIEMQPLGPTPFSYAHDPFAVMTTQKDEQDIPEFEITDSSSSNLVWTISPSFTDADDFVFLDNTTADAKDEGIIRMKRGVTPKVMDLKEYTVTCALVLQGQVVTTRSTTVGIVVTLPPTPTPAPDPT